MKLMMLCLLSLLFSASVFAEEEGKIGFSASVAVSGFFSPELDEVIVKEVYSDSAAEEAGLKAGDKIMAIDGCKIPGCGASKAKALMKRAPGELLPLVIEDENGNSTELVIHVR